VRLTLPLPASKTAASSLSTKQIWFSMILLSEEEAWTVKVVQQASPMNIACPSSKVLTVTQRYESPLSSKA
jgi:hypothetical protein